MLTQGLNQYQFRKKDLFTCTPMCLADLIWKLSFSFPVIHTSAVVLSEADMLQMLHSGRADRMTSDGMITLSSSAPFGSLKLMRWKLC